MMSTAKPRSSMRLPESSIIFPICVITVALAAFSPAFSVFNREISRTAATIGISLTPVAPPRSLDEGFDLEALDAWPSPEIARAE